MKLYILRHGEAGPASTDRVRPLTPRGREQIEQVVAARHVDLGAVSVVITSPLRRARETGAVVARALNYAGELVVSDTLAPEGTPAAVSRLLHAIDEQTKNDEQTNNQSDANIPEQSVLLVSHQPLAGQLVAWLTGRTQTPWMDTGCLAALDITACVQNGAELLYMERPTP